MLLVCSVDTPIHINTSHLLVSRCASCVDWAYRLHDIAQIMETTVVSLGVHTQCSSSTVQIFSIFGAVLRCYALCVCVWGGVG